MSDSINHPAHYNASAIEVIDAIDAWQLGFCLGNAVKYIARAEHKGNTLEDLKKAQWYLTHEINEREKQAAIPEKKATRIVRQVRKTKGKRESN